MTNFETEEDDETLWVTQNWQCWSLGYNEAESWSQSYEANFGINYIKNGLDKLNFTLNYINFDVIYAEKVL